jgi:Molecular chaperone (small heat shock protein)
MALIRWDPFREMETMKEAWSPSVDIYETENEIVIKAELPGMEAKDIDIKLENNVLMLKGERRFERESNKDNYHRVEMSYGNFSRSFSLPAFVDENKVRAEYNDGLLKVFLPKKEQAKSKQIKIQAAA